MNNESTAWILKKLQDNNTFPLPEKGRDSPQPIVPFEEFQRMFDQYTESAAVARTNTQIDEGVRIGASKIPEPFTPIGYNCHISLFIFFCTYIFWPLPMDHSCYISFMYSI